MLSGPNRFAPASLTVKVGTSVVWFNDTVIIHNVRSDDGTGQLNSPSIGARQTFSHTFTSTGTYTYVCTFHAGMAGSITVEP